MTKAQVEELEHRARKESDKPMADFYAWISMRRDAQVELVDLLESVATANPVKWNPGLLARVTEVTARLALLNAASEYQR